MFFAMRTGSEEPSEGTIVKHGAAGLCALSPAMFAAETL
jgi:hypothetical protein